MSGWKTLLKILAKTVNGAPNDDALEQRVADLSAKFPDRKLIVVSNREPAQHFVKEDGSVGLRFFAGGLTTAMEPVLRAAGGTWVAAGQGDTDFEVLDAEHGVELDGYRLRRVSIPEHIYDDYYNGYANGALWPLFHNAYSEPVFRAHEWHRYEEANRLFAQAILEEAGDQPALILVNDYHFMLLPKMLRDSGKDLAIALFWHIPWPGRRVLRACPNQAALYDGMLGADLIGFHATEHVVNFLDTMDRSVESLVSIDQHTVTRSGRTTFVRAYPISIDVDEVREGAERAPFEETFPDLHETIRDRILLLGVDRLDYTKGIPHRVEIFRTMLERHPELRGRVILAQIGAPSRFQIDKYRQLAEEVENKVALTNQMFATPDWTPVQLLASHYDRRKLFGLYRRADVMLVTSLHDGMNLVAKEYVAAKSGECGTLVLSQFAGAADEFPEACLVNPFDIDGSAWMLGKVLLSSPEERTRNMQSMHSRLVAHDVYHWIDHLLTGLKDALDRTEAERQRIRPPES
ncbi:MAG: trehalose-6-phosphate synthase [Fibrobacteria bacterium]|nr:trehalose-6-phosphate synthase [Fibrobacteria bacterium]